MAAQSSPQAKSPAHRQALGVCVFLVAITWLVFGQTVRYDFVNFDDDTYVYANPSITSGLTVHGGIRAFSGKHSDNWHPLTTISHMLDCHLWGLRADGHHFTNIVLHTIAVVLLFLVLQQMQLTRKHYRSRFVIPLHIITWESCSIRMAEQTKPSLTIKKLCNSNPITQWHITCWEMTCCEKPALTTPSRPWPVAATQALHMWKRSTRPWLQSAIAKRNCVIPSRADDEGPHRCARDHADHV